jgi:hypothetical protein
LKLDRSFITAITASPLNAARLSHALGLSVVAAGFEMAEKLEFLWANGCDVVQDLQDRAADCDEKTGELGGWLRKASG